MESNTILNGFTKLIVNSPLNILLTIVNNKGLLLGAVAGPARWAGSPS